LIRCGEGSSEADEFFVHRLRIKDDGIVNGRVVLIVVAILAIGAWWMIGPRNSWRYKMIVEVDTPEGARSGYAVRKVSYSPRGIGFLAESRAHWRLTGEAISIDLPNGRTLFALLRGGGRSGGVDYGARIADRALGGQGGRISGWPGPVDLYPSAPKRDVFTVTNPLPMFVTFSDPRDSRSVQRVDPDNLAAAFGAGYALKRVSIEIVSGSVTKGIAGRLPWIGKVSERSLDPGYGVTATPTLAQQLTVRDFRQGK
jgi:hypothetical protein